MGAFLLNMNEFQFISQQENKGNSVPSKVSDDPVPNSESIVCVCVCAYNIFMCVYVLLTASL